MRVGIIALLHESNTFISRPTVVSDFEQNLLATGETIRERLAATNHEIGGFFAGLAEHDIEAVPIFAARAVPFGALTADCFARLLKTMFESLEGAGELDGILVAPHGATVCESHRDADGYWLSLLRDRVGTAMPIVGTLDPHANLSSKMVESTDALIAYRSNPHLDQRKRGLEAAGLMARFLRKEVRPTQAAAFPPLAINIERQCTDEPACRPLYETADQMLEQPGVLTNSIFLGFPYADVEEMGSAVLVVTNDDPALAERHADDLARCMWQRREEFVGRLTAVDDAVMQCGTGDGPICLLDMGDNAGGGSPADSTFLAHAIRKHGINNSFVCLYDPQAVSQATACGPGATIAMEVGGKTDDQHGEPLKGDFRVVSLHDGRFRETEVRHGGYMDCDQGATAILLGDHNMTIMVTSRRMPPFSLQQLISCGLEPAGYQVLVAKGVNAPIAAYKGVCKRLIRVNTPGCTTADMRQLTFHHRRRPMFPFEEGVQWRTSHPPLV